MAENITYSRNLSNRKFDFDWFSISEATLKGEVNFDFGSPTPKKITGLDKMVQKWLLFFMTPNGSDVYDPNMGTDFYQVMEASANDRGYVSNLISAAVGDASEQLLASQREIGDSPDDEKFVSATLLGIEYLQTSIDVRIRIMSNQGASRVLTLPTPFNNAAPV